MMLDYILRKCQNVMITILAPLSHWLLILCEQSQVFVWSLGRKAAAAWCSALEELPKTTWSI